MKDTLKSLAVLALFVVAACTPKQENAEAAEDADEWAELDAFHVFMADLFHPYKDSSNLAPLKAQAGQFAAEAEKWAAAPLPEKVNTDEMKQMLEKLRADTQALADLVQNGAADEQLGAALTALHDHFHDIQEAWYGGDHHHHDH
jgi:hypothetical protein